MLRRKNQKKFRPTGVQESQGGFTPLETTTSPGKAKELHASLTGFTLVELLIATAVFSVILLLCSVTIIQISRLYYKGIISARTQEVARSATDEIARAIQFVGVQVIPLPPAGGISAAKGFCLDGKLYSYVLDKRKVEGPLTGSKQSNYVFVVNDAANCKAGITTVQPIDIATPVGRELMGINMRLGDDPTPSHLTTTADPGQTLYKININVIYGDDDLLENAAPPYTGCKSTYVGGQFCSISALSTKVEKRVK